MLKVLIKIYFFKTCNIKYMYFLKYSLQGRQLQLKDIIKRISVKRMFNTRASYVPNVC